MAYVKSFEITFIMARSYFQDAYCYRVGSFEVRRGLL